MVCASHSEKIYFPRIYTHFFLLCFPIPTSIFPYKSRTVIHFLTIFLCLLRMGWKFVGFSVEKQRKKLFAVDVEEEKIWWKNPMWFCCLFIFFFNILSSCCSWRLHINQYYTMRFPCTHIRNMHQKHICGSSIKNLLFANA